MNQTKTEHKLPSNLYRRFLMMTGAWEGKRANPGSLLIKSYEGGEGLPFFWCGWPNNLTSFYEAFGNERPIYCICGTFEVVKPSEQNIKTLATYYASEIVQIQPQGPYLLGGFCEAAMISYEIAKILVQQGYEVGDLILIERDVTDYNWQLKSAHQCFKFLDSFFRRLIELREAPLRCIQGVLSNKYVQLRGQIKVLAAKFNNKSAEMLSIQPGYRLTPYNGVVTLIFVRWGSLGYFQFDFFQRYWKKLLSEQAKIIVIEGYSHYDPKNWPTVAKIVRKRLLEVEFKSGITSSTMKIQG